MTPLERAINETPQVFGAKVALDRRHVQDGVFGSELIDRAREKVACALALKVIGEYRGATPPDFTIVWEPPQYLDYALRPSCEESSSWTQLIISATVTLETR